MKSSLLKTKILVKSLLFFTAVLLLTIDASPDDTKTTISFIMGDIKIMRNEKSILLNQGNSPKEGDIFRLSRKSIVEFNLGKKNRKIKVNGPQIFVFKTSNLKKGIKKSNMLSSLFSKMSKSTPHYYPRTIVSAVRKGGEENDRINKQSKIKIKEAIDLYKNGEIDKSWKILEDLEKTDGIKRHAKSVIKFYQAGIHFERMNYNKALPIYRKLYEKKFSKFKHKEESLGRAIICSYYINNETLTQNLIKEYKSNYGWRGAYWKYIKNLI